LNIASPILFNTQYAIRNTLLPLFLAGLLTLFIFIFLDGLWLKALPSLELSFGPAKLPFVVFGVARGGIFMAWLFIILWANTRKSRPSPANWFKLLLAPNLLLLVLGLYGFLVEPQQLTVSQVEIQAAGLDHPLRIVQLSDLHVERATRRELGLPQRVAELKPDLIVLTGDYLNTSYLDDPIAIHDLREMVGQLYAPLGIYAVDGTVEEPERTQFLFAGLNVRVLDNEVISLPAAGKNFKLVGLSNRVIANDTLVLKSLMAGLSRADYTLLMYHNPDQAYVASELGVDLYLTGHTHGGQVRLPLYGALLTSSKFGKTFEQGSYSLGNMMLYVNRGVGMEGSLAPRVRFLAPPEIAVIDLIPEARSDER
jgi:predicted MPP superfamily phosphohydrolase